MLYYICGYVTTKEGIFCTDAGDAVPLPPEYEFTLKLSRGKLKMPPINLYDLSQYYYAIIKARNAKCCAKIFLEAFKETHSYTGYDFENIFFKAFVKKSSENMKSNDMRETKKRRLSSKSS